MRPGLSVIVTLVVHRNPFNSEPTPGRRPPHLRQPTYCNRSESKNASRQFAGASINP